MPNRVDADFSILPYKIWKLPDDLMYRQQVNRKKFEGINIYRKTASRDRIKSLAGLV